MKYALVLALTLMACSSQDIQPAHKGRMFDRTGVAALWIGGDGLTGEVLQPGTYFTGLYDDVRQVDCSQKTVKEELTALTKDGVQFELDVYVRFSADCSSENVIKLLDTLQPDKDGSITTEQLYGSYVRPLLGEAVRETVSPYIANDINDKRETILDTIRKSFQASVKDLKLVVVQETVLSNIDYPEAMDTANTQRAVQAILKDKAIAERDRVAAETETATQKILLAKKEGEVEAARIDEIGASLKRNPEYLQYDMQLKMPAMYEAAGAKGNMIIAAPSPSIIVNGK